MFMRLFSFFLLTLSLGACVSKPDPAPVVERLPGSYSGISGDNVKDYERKEVYVVQSGDTLYGIALKNGLDVNQLAEMNDIADPRELRVGQKLYLRTLAGQGQIPDQEDLSSQPTLFSISQPGDVGVAGYQPGTLSDGSNYETTESFKTEPKGVLLPYSDTARDQLNNQSGAAQVDFEPYQVSSIKEPSKNKSDQSANVRTNNSSINWGWPTSGQIISQFSEKSKGVGIGGQLKQAVLASASGTVVYSGSGLRGYGNLIIIKHNDSYLSAYGHNSKIFVHEGDSVSKGQKIAEMGNTDGGVVKLHFEIREKGKPVDPLGYLPTR